MALVSFVIACKRFFGIREGESLMDFNTEVKALTNADRAEMAPLLGAALGCEVSS
jgi:hypothetical protein